MTNYYVSSKIGNDQSSSSGVDQNAPFASIQKAADVARAGDTVFIMPGDYKNSDPNQNVVTVFQSGTAIAPITFKAFDPNNKPVIQVRNHAGIEVVGSYINLDGLIVQGNRSEFDGMTAEQVDAWQKAQGRFNPITSGSGIIVGSFYRQSYPTHVQITNSIVRDMPGGGIATVRADYITVENNEVYRNAFYSPYNNSGISFYQNSNSDNSTGIKFIVRGNTVYGNQNLINDYNNFSEANINSPDIALRPKITDGNGIIVDDATRTQVKSIDNGQSAQNLPAFLGKTIIEGNRVFDNGGRGIEAFNSANVEIRNNIVANNLLTPNITGQNITNNSTAAALAKGAGNGVIVENNTAILPVVASSPIPLASVNTTPLIPTLAIVATSNNKPYSEASGTSGNDILTGNSGAYYNNLFGGAGSDALYSTNAVEYNYLMGNKGDDQIDLSSSKRVLDIVSYESGDGRDTITNFDHSSTGKNDQIYFKGINNIDIISNNGNVEFRVGDGVAGNAGFGSGELLVTLIGTPQFQANDVGLLLMGSNFSFG